MLESDDETKQEIEKIYNDTVKLLKEQDDLMDKQQSKLKETEKSYQDQANYYKNFLKQKGFSFSFAFSTPTPQFLPCSFPICTLSHIYRGIYS